MILVHSPDELLVRSVVRDLHERGLPALPVAPDSHVFSEVVAHTAQAVVGLLPHDTRVAEDEAFEFVRELIAASSAPSAPRIVLVTPAPSHALHVQALRRSGAPYVVISTDKVVTLAPAAYLPRSTVWVDRALLCDAHAIATSAGLHETIARAVHDEAPLGVELGPAPVHWDAALRASSVPVVCGPSWLVRLAALVGRPALYRSADGELIVRLGYERVARALGALPGPRSA
jgi:hypothetical protein